MKYLQVKYEKINTDILLMGLTRARMRRKRYGRTYETWGVSRSVS